MTPPTDRRARFEELVDLSFERPLEPAESAELEALCAAEPAWRAELAQEQALVGLLREVGTRRAPAGLAAAALQQVGPPAEPAEGFGEGRWRGIQQLGALAAGLMLFGALYFFMNPTTGPERGPMGGRPAARDVASAPAAAPAEAAPPAARQLAAPATSAEDAAPATATRRERAQPAREAKAAPALESAAPAPAEDFFGSTLTDATAGTVAESTPVPPITHWIAERPGLEARVIADVVDQATAELLARGATDLAAPGRRPGVRFLVLADPGEVLAYATGAAPVALKSMDLAQAVGPPAPPEGTTSAEDELDRFMANFGGVRLADPVSGAWRLPDWSTARRVLAAIETLGGPVAAAFDVTAAEARREAGDRWVVTVPPRVK